MINLTTAAALKLETFITDKKVVRLAVEGGGCAGFQYRFGLVPIAETFEDDYIVEKLGVKLFVDAISYMYLENVEIDYEDTHFSSAFKINNPDTVRTCGCGSSFS
jgi:iron-sulfur cluster assembly accessory protein